MCRVDGNYELLTPERQAELQGRLSAFVPPHPAAQEALTTALSVLPISIFNHSFRVFLYAKALSTSPGVAGPAVSAVESVSVEPYVLFVACMLHDLAVIDRFDAAPARFEVVGADEAVALLRRHGAREASIREAWLAMSLHTSPGVLERIGGAVGHLRRAVKADFGSWEVPLALMSEPDRQVIEDVLPRKNIEKELGDSVVRQALKDRNKAPSASWPGVLLRAHDDNPGWQGVNKGF
jgi:hypothetical protein